MRTTNGQFQFQLQKKSYEPIRNAEAFSPTNGSAGDSPTVWAWPMISSIEMYRSICFVRYECEGFIAWSFGRNPLECGRRGSFTYVPAKPYVLTYFMYVPLSISFLLNEIAELTKYRRKP
ncbi:hypothetical protein EVAR_39103_1 [Eumeta japonica]|uniref:Uncharacterized protein n=1 Tax=Eumeta variegata TaxID=151549 RepID=A0A4C1X7U7_EUMVA|nr:hypothetical protein EVAR_39103_1 [Eumeta japonica]